MARNEVDLVDVAALVALPIFSGMVFGIWSLSIDVFGGYDFTQSLWSSGGTAISAAFIVSVLSVAWILLTNELDGSNYETYEYGAIIVALAATPAYELIPALGDVISSNDAIALVVWLLVSVVATYLAYTE